MQIVFIPTWRCDIEAEVGKCPYCINEVSKDGLSVRGYWQDAVTTEAREAKASEWISFLSKQGSCLLDICGGEPLSWGGLPELLGNLPSGVAWAITSNCFAFDVIKGLDFSNCVFWTASFHPHAVGKADYLKRFAHSIEFLAGKKMPMSITIVGYPPNLDWLPFWVQAFLGWGFNVNVLPYESPKYDWREHLTELRKLSVLNDFIPEGRTIYWETRPGKRLCRAGKDYVVASPSGNIYRCYKRMVTGEAPLGNAFSGDDFLLKEATMCELACSTSCDLERRDRDV